RARQSCSVTRALPSFPTRRSSDLTSPGFHPCAWKSLTGPEPNSSKPVWRSLEKYCQCRSPLTTNSWSTVDRYCRNQAPSVLKFLLAWLSYLVFRSRPTIGVGEISNLNAAVESGGVI